MTQHNLQERQTNQLEQMGQQIVSDDELDSLKEKLSNLKGNESLKELSLQVIKTADRKGLDLVFPIGSPLFYMVFSEVFNKTKHNITLYFSHTMREVKETKLKNGEIEKKMVFNHQGFHIYTKEEIIYKEYAE